ncbi:MAG: hypothetical protein IT440_15700 [Phycisphaeraceae bacterium]|nr:hypothetical protein [Phycisphaeraceae bacterium]
MNLQQSLQFLNQSSEKLEKSRARLDKACRIIADKISLSEAARDGDNVTVDGRVYQVTRMESRSLGSEWFLASMEDSEYRRGFICVEKGHYLHGDFNCWLEPAPRNDKVNFATHAAEIVNAFAALWEERANTADNAAKSAESVKN